MCDNVCIKEADKESDQYGNTPDCDNCLGDYGQCDCDNQPWSEIQDERKDMTQEDFLKFCLFTQEFDTMKEIKKLRYYAKIWKYRAHVAKANEIKYKHYISEMLSGIINVKRPEIQ